MNETDENFKHPLTKLEDFYNFMNRIPYDKREEISDHFEVIRTNLTESVKSYIQLESFIEAELTAIKVRIQKIICEEKRPPEDELVEYQHELIGAKQGIYSVIEKFTNTLEKCYFKPEVIEKYSSK